MTTFCSICLRSKLNIRSIKNENLIYFYDELCDYASGSKTQLCAECMYKLNKCFEFKKYCRLAAEKLKMWAKQPKEKKKPRHLLYTEMPESQLGLCNKNNYKIYIYQTEDVDEAAPIQISSSRSPHIVTINIPASAGQMQDSVEELNLWQTDNFKESVKQEQDIKVEFVDFTDNGDQLDMDVTYETKTIVEKKRKLSEELRTEDDLTDSDISVRNTNSVNDDGGLSSDESIKEVEKILEILDKRDAKKEKETTKSKRKPIDIEELRTKLEEKFKIYEPVKDEDGNIIDKDVVLNNLDKVQYLFTLRRLCLAPGPFGPSAIRKLAKIHKRFANDDSTPYIKVFLGTEAEILAEFQKRRQNINYTKFSHRCEQCLKGFSQSWFLEYHHKSSHNPELPFECAICHCRTTTRRLLVEHMATHKRVLKCKLCTFTCGQRHIMLCHVNQHKGVKYPCKQCGNNFSSPSCLAAHLNTHSARHICALCADAFTTPKGFRMHKRRKHAGEVFVEDKDNTKCEKCDILFLSSEVYNKHVRRTHKKQRETTELLYTCRLCDWKGPRRALQKEHYRTEHPEAAKSEPHKDYNFLCHDCGKRFKFVYSYMDHMNKHNGTKPHACTKCPKTFSSRMVLYTHLKSHLAPSKECPHCGKKFITSIGLHNHMQRHLPPTKECPHCGKMFTTNTGLSGHLRIHRNDRHFKCHICGKGFLHSSSLTAHVAGVHYNKRRQRKPRQQDMDIDTD